MLDWLGLPVGSATVHRKVKRSLRHPPWALPEERDEGVKEESVEGLPRPCTPNCFLDHESAFLFLSLLFVWLALLNVDRLLLVLVVAGVFDLLVCFRWNSLWDPPSLSVGLLLLCYRRRSVFEAKEQARDDVGSPKCLLI